MKTTTFLEPEAATTVRRESMKPVLCQACGRVTEIKSRHYYWLLTKDKTMPCRHCGRPLVLSP